MVSKPTGGKRGRPKKMAVAPSPKRGRGQPEKPFAQDPDRWDLALVERHVLVGKLMGYSKLSMEDFLATLAVGAIVRTPENLACFENDLPTWFYMPPHKKFPQPPAERAQIGWPWRVKTPFHPLADDSRGRRRRIRKEDPERLLIMVATWDAAISGDFDEARRLAGSIGDLEAFEADLQSRRIPVRGARISGGNSFPI
jgi:hypothetical protein